MALSQNKWQALTNGSSHLHRWVIPDTDRYFLLRDGSAGFVLAHVALWFHEKIERLDLGIWDEWGWAYRPIRGQEVELSNHASGTAVDLNATRHPRGVATEKTFTPPQMTLIRKVLTDRYDGVVRWGGDYHSVPDAMHFEINVPPFAATERVAKALMKSKRGKVLLAANPGQEAVILS